MSDSEPLSTSPVYLTGFSVEKTFGLTRYYVARIKPDAFLQSATGKTYPVWLAPTVEAHLAGGAA